MPPTRYLDLGIPAWGETDFLLTQALDAHESAICSCGCGQWRADAHNPDLADEWSVVDTTCYPREAMSRWREQNKDAGPGTLLGVRLGGPTEADTEHAAAEIEAMQRRHGLI